MGMDMWIDYENPMDMNMDMGMTFENGYGCWYSYTQPKPTPCPSLMEVEGRGCRRLTLRREIQIWRYLIAASTLERF